jgi:hypothetical protein
MTEGGPTSATRTQYDVILSEAKNPCIEKKSNAEILRCAQDDIGTETYYAIAARAESPAPAEAAG